MNKAVTIVEKGKKIKLELTENDVLIDEGNGHYSLYVEEDDKGDEDMKDNMDSGEDAPADDEEKPKDEKCKK